MGLSTNFTLGRPWTFGVLWLDPALIPPDAVEPQAWVPPGLPPVDGKAGRTPGLLAALKAPKVVGGSRELDLSLQPMRGVLLLSYQAPTLHAELYGRASFKDFFGFRLRF